MSTLTIAFAVGAEVIPVAGPFTGYTGEVDELDFTDNKPYRVRFDMPGDPVAWYAETDLYPAGGAR